MADGVVGVGGGGEFGEAHLQVAHLQEAPEAQTGELAAIEVCIVLGWEHTGCLQSNGKTPAWIKITSKSTNRKQDRVRHRAAAT